MHTTIQRVLRDPKRLASVERLLTTDPNNDELFDRISRVTAAALRSPMSIVNFIGAKEQVFKGCIGLPEPFASTRRLPVSSGFCPLVLSHGSTVVIDDVRKHRSYAKNPVVEKWNMSAYAGALLQDDGGAPVGTVCVADTRVRAWTDYEMELLEDIAATVMVQLKAQLPARDDLRALEVQRRVLPVSLPDVPTMQFDAMYAPAQGSGRGCGDWFDALRLLDGRILLSVGDVGETGIDAALIMANLRQIIRGVAQIYPDPMRILDAADRALWSERSDGFATAFVAIADPVAGTLSYASAGHPPAMLRKPDGSVLMLRNAGLPLGLRAAAGAVTASTVRIVPNALLVLYTNGITNVSRRPIAGERRLRALVQRADVAFSDKPANEIGNAALSQIESAHDDVVVLTVRFNGSTISAERPQPHQTWAFDVADAKSARAIRNDFRERLQQYGAASEDVVAAEIVFGELVGNVLRYAPGPIEITVDWSGIAPVLHVVDRGPGFRQVPMLPVDLYAESGRGLFLVSALTQDFHVSKRYGGGSHARAVLSLRQNRLGGLAVPDALVEND